MLCGLASLRCTAFVIYDFDKLTYYISPKDSPTIYALSYIHSREEMKRSNVPNKKSDSNNYCTNNEQCSNHSIERFCNCELSKTPPKDRENETPHNQRQYNWYEHKVFWIVIIDPVHIMHRQPESKACTSLRKKD